MKKLVTLSAILFAACGDDTKATPDAAVNMPDADPMVDAPPMYQTPAAAAVTLSATGPDQLLSAVAGPSGTFYAAGFAAATAAGDRMVVVAKLTATGTLDTGFGGGDGFYTSDLVFEGGSDDIDLVVQSTGKIVVAATIANDTDPDDRDIGLIRVNADGTLDASFGEDDNGFQRLDLSTGFDDAGTPAATDAQRGLALGPSDTLFVHAASRDNDGLEDTDFTVAKLSEDGVLDTNYGTDGKHLLELDETNGSAVVRGLVALSDGSVIASGYARTADTKINPGDANGTPQPVLYKLDPDGVLDDSFAGDGLFHESVLTLQTEIYAFALDGTNITTAGYGRDTGMANVWASLRFNATDGTRSTTFGNETAGVVTVDPSGNLAGANCRNAIGLPGGKTALIGSTGGGEERDAALAILTPSGELDTAYGTGVHTWDHVEGGVSGGEDQWWGGAVSGDKLLLVGWRGLGDTQTDAANDNAYRVLIDLE